MKAADAGRSCLACGLWFYDTKSNFYTRRRRGRVEYLERCKDCIKKDRAEYRLANPDLIREANRINRQRHGKRHRKERWARTAADPVKLAAQKQRIADWEGENQEHVWAYRRAKYLANKERRKVADREYRAANKDKVRVWGANRKARRRNAEGTFTVEDVAAAMAAQDGICFWCPSPVADDFHIDHYIPLAKGGSNWPDNIVIACPTCNISKRDKMPEEFVAYQMAISGVAAEIERRRAYFAEYRLRRKAA